MARIIVHVTSTNGQASKLFCENLASHIQTKTMSVLKVADLIRKQCASSQKFAESFRRAQVKKISMPVKEVMPLVLRALKGNVSDVIVLDGLLVNAEYLHAAVKHELIGGNSCVCFVLPPGPPRDDKAAGRFSDMCGILLKRKVPCHMIDLRKENTDHACTEVAKTVTILDHSLEASIVRRPNAEIFSSKWRPFQGFNASGGLAIQATT